MAARLPNPGELVGHYRIVSALGRGAMGAVFLATAPSGEPRALKLLLAEDEELRRRFEREAALLTRLPAHPHLVRLHDTVRWQGALVLVLDFIPARPLDELVARDGPPPVEAALRWIRSLAEALELVHAQGIVHRDIKAGNVLIREDSQAVLTDFGLGRGDEDARLTRSQDLVGTPAVMAPEQAALDHASVGPAADIWGLGALLFELVTGRRAFTAMHIEALRLAIIGQAPPRPRALRPELDPKVELVILKCLEKDPADRYPCAAALAEDCRRCLEGLPLETRLAESRLEAARRWGSQNAWVIGALVILVVLLSGSATFAWLRARARVAMRDEWRRAAADELRAFASVLQRAQRLELRLTLGPTLAESIRRPELIPASERALLAELEGELGKVEARLAQGRASSRLSGAADELVESGAWSRRRDQARCLIKAPADPQDSPRHRLLTAEDAAARARLAPELDASDDLTRATLGVLRARDARDAGRAREAWAALDGAGLAGRLGRLEAEAEQTYLRAAIVEALAAGELDKGLAEPFEALVEAADDPELLWDSLQAELAAALGAKTVSEAADAVEGFGRWTERWPALREVLWPPRLATALAERAAARDEVLEALRLYLTVRDRDPSFELPPAFARERLEQRALLMLSEGEAGAWSCLEIAVAASRAGMYLSIMPRPALEHFEEQGRISAQVAAAPDEPWWRFWRAQVPADKGRAGGDLGFVGRCRERLADLELCLADPRIQGQLRGAALLRKVTLLVEVGPPKRGINAWRQGLVQQLAAAEELPLAKPESPWRLRARILEGYEERLRALEAARRLLDERARRTLEGELAVGRSPLAPWHPCARDEHLPHVIVLLEDLGELHLDSGHPERAVEPLRQALLQGETLGARRALIRAYLATGELELARETLARGLAHHGDKLKDLAARVEAQ